MSELMNLTVGLLRVVSLLAITTSVVLAIYRVRPRVEQALVPAAFALWLVSDLIASRPAYR